MKTSKDDTLLTPDNHALLMIDHQYLQLLALRSHPSEAVVNNSVFLAKAAKVFKVPTLYTTAFAERQALFEELQAVHPEQVPIDRTRSQLLGRPARPGLGQEDRQEEAGDGRPMDRSVLEHAGAVGSCR